MTSQSRLSQLSSLYTLTLLHHLITYIWKWLFFGTFHWLWCYISVCLFSSDRLRPSRFRTLNFSTESHRSCWSCFDNIVYWRTSSDQPVALHLGCLRTICLSVVCHLVNDEERLSFSVWQSHKWSIHSFKMRQTISSSAGSDVNTNTLYNREKMVMMMKMNREERRHRDRLCFYSSCFSFRAIMIKF